MRLECRVAIVRASEANHLGQEKGGGHRRVSQGQGREGHVPVQATDKEWGG